MRAYAVELLFFSFDNDKKSLLYKVDPAGFYLGYWGASSGVKEQEVQNVMEKAWREKCWQDFKREELIKITLKSLQNSLGQDFKRGDIEVAVVDEHNQEIVKLSDEEIEGFLKVIQNEEE